MGRRARAGAGAERGNQKSDEVEWHHLCSTSAVHPTYKQHINATWVIICTHSTTQHVNRMYRGGMVGSQGGAKTNPNQGTNTTPVLARPLRRWITMPDHQTYTNVVLRVELRRPCPPTPPGHYLAHLRPNQREPDAVRQANRRHTYACSRMNDACNAAVLMQTRTSYIPKLRDSTHTGTYNAVFARGDTDPQLSPRGFSAPTSSGHLCTTPMPPEVVNFVPKTSHIHSYRHT